MKQGKKVQFFYELHRNPPGLVGRFPDGTTYRSLLDGRTYWLLNGQYEVPVPGCPFPGQLFAANVFAFLFKNRRMVINSMFFIAALVVMQFFIWQLPGDALDEAKLSFISLISFALNGVLLLAGCILTLTLLIWNFGKGVTFPSKEDEAVLSLTDGQISISPDVLVMSGSENENPSDMADRIELARAVQKNGQWIVILTFRHKDGLIIFTSDNSDDVEFDGYRFQRTDWGEAHQAANCKHYPSETWAQYTAYCRKFAADFSEWSAEEKPRHIDPVTALTQRLRAAAVKMIVLLLICVSGALSAQKSAQVSNYLGQYRYDNVKPAGEVKFIFEKVILKRGGKGDKTYKQLLRDGISYTDADNAGRLVGITVSGQVIEAESAGAVVMPKKQGRMVSSIATSETRPIPDALSIPDSVAMEQKLEGVKTQVDKWRSEVWKSIRPVWAFVMWFFTSILAPVLVLLGGWMRYIAKSAAGEGAVNSWGGSIFGPFMVWVHQNFSASLMVIVWTAATILLFDSFLWLVWWGFSLWSIIPVWLLELWIAQALTNWIVPNVRVISNGNQAANRFPQIGG